MYILQSFELNNLWHLTKNTLNFIYHRNDEMYTYSIGLGKI